MAKRKTKSEPVLTAINVKNVPKDLWRRFVGMAKIENRSAGEALEALIADYCIKERDRQEREMRHV